MAKKKISNNDNSNILNITQWVIPTAILFVYVLVTLYSFSSDMRNDAHYSVRQKVSEYNDSLILSFNAKLDVTRAVANVTAGVVSKELEAGNDPADILNEAEASTLGDAFSLGAMVVDSTGKSLASVGEETSYTAEIALKKCIDEKMTVCSDPYEEDGKFYVNVYAPVKDRSGDAKYAVCYLFDPEVFSEIPTTSKFDGRTCYVLLSDNGDVVSLAGRLIMSRGDNLFESDNIQISAAHESRTKSNLSNRNAGYADCVIAGEDRVMVFDPTKYSGLAIASLVTGSYIDNEVHSTYGDMESILIRILVAMVAFFIAILAIHFANKAVNIKHNQTLQEKAETDLLTGLLNKISTEQKVNDYLEEAKNKDQSAILYLIDIDNFKKVNDTMGHAFGDELLAGLGLGLSTLFRATDIVGRIGGDEFLVLMRNINPDEETKRREADKLLAFFRDFKVGEYVQYRCTASIGGAVFSQDGGNFDELYKAADNAMYESKRHGKNRVAYYGEKLDGPVTELGRH